MPRSGPYAAAALLLLLAACSSESTVKPLLSGPVVPLPPPGTWALSVDGCPEPKQCDELRTALVGHLIGAGLAARIAPPGEAGDLLLDVHVTRIRSVSNVSRAIIGTFAGRNVVAGTSTLRDLTGAVLRSVEIEAESAAHPLSGETTLLDADRVFATETVAALR